MWSTAELSTNVSISNLESEVVSLASPLFANDVITVCGTEDDKTFITPSYVYSEIFEKGMILKSDSDYLTVSIFDYDEPREKFYVTPNIPDTTLWQGKNFYYWTQQSKIEQAKTMLGMKLKKYLKKSAYAGYFDEDTNNILDYVIINDELKLASDYLVLMLIYEDLKQENNNYENKYFFYAKRFDSFLSDALDLMELDLDGDGTADVKSANITRTVFITL